jgi:hypothetical protein
LAGICTQDAAEVTLIGEADISGQARQVVLAGCKSLERRSRAQPHAMAGDRVAGRDTEDAAEVMG